MSLIDSTKWVSETEWMRVEPENAKRKGAKKLGVF